MAVPKKQKNAPKKTASTKQSGPTPIPEAFNPDDPGKPKAVPKKQKPAPKQPASTKRKKSSLLGGEELPNSGEDLEEPVHETVNPDDHVSTNVSDVPAVSTNVSDVQAEAPDEVQEENEDTNLQVTQDYKSFLENSDYSDDPGEEFSDNELDRDHRDLQSIQCHNDKDIRIPILRLCKFNVFFSCGHVPCNIDNPIYPYMQQNFPTYMVGLAHACS